MKYKIHIPYVNRQDLLRDAIASVQGAFENIHVWSTGAMAPDVSVQTHSLAPMPFTSMMNSLIASSWDDDVMFFMHNDALAINGGAQKFMEFVQEKFSSNERWGVIFTHYDVLCAFNMRAVRSVGFWDPQLYQYVSDNDYYNKLRNAGWAKVDTRFGADNEQACGIVHRNASSTVKADGLFDRLTRFRGSFDQSYYAFKWGGKSESEKFFYPFDAVHLEKLLEPTPLLEALQSDPRTEGNLLDDSSETRRAQLHTMYEYITRLQPRRILETGTNKGYFGYLLTRMLTDFSLLTCDGDERSATAAQLLGPRVQFLLGDSYNTLRPVTDRFDMAWIDGGHAYEPAFSDICNAMRLCIPCIMIDDTNTAPVLQAIDVSNLASSYHLIEPYSYQRDERKMIVAMRKA